ncbi:histidine kinase [Mucilaginibacter sp. CSA2-8R]|uniref:sensor histidine kinase n=1 Tax=Mucilaginibacter sp. CSA2-8R TaxID=3141542 RepID=UPI00315D7C6E
MSMNASMNKSFFGKNLYFYLAVIGGGLLFAPIDAYVSSVGIHADEAVAVAVSVFFVLAVFAGRYIMQVWSASLNSLPKVFLAVAGLLILFSGVWLFFHARFSLGRRTGILFFVPMMLLGLAAGALVKVVHAVTENQLLAAKSEAAQNKSELHLLQSQLSPHFLFNTLNNLYGLSLTDHQKLPPLLLKLAELLRYSVYDVSALYVPLASEMAYLRNYIEFERIRIGEKLVLTTDLEDMVDAEVMIAPMLLIVFLENAFKHSKNTADQQIFVHVSLKTWENSILFTVKNTYGNEETSSNSLDDRSSGFGLHNVNKRLEMLYPDTHELQVSKDEKFYKVALQLKTQYE